VIRYLNLDFLIDPHSDPGAQLTEIFYHIRWRIVDGNNDTELILHARLHAPSKCWCVVHAIDSHRKRNGTRTPGPAGAVESCEGGKEQSRQREEVFKEIKQE